MIRVTTIEDKVTLEGIGTFAAKALRWEEAGTDGRGNQLVSVYDIWARRFLLFRGRAELLIDEDNTPLIAPDENLEEAVNQKVTQQIQPAGATYIWAEEATNLNNNARQWSWGNGMSESRNYLIMPSAGLVTTLSLNVINAPSSTCTVQLLIDGASAGSVSLAAGEANAVADLDPAIGYQRGSALMFRTVISGGAKKGTVVARLQPQ